MPRAPLEPMLVAGLQPGGQLMITTDVENYPGFAAAVQGPWLMEQMAAQATHVGTRVVSDIITSVDFSRQPFRCHGDSGDTYLADSVIIATGAQARWLGLEVGAAAAGHLGVSACGDLRRVLLSRQAEWRWLVAAITAVEEALFLTHHAAEVTLIHRRDETARRQGPTSGGCLPVRR